MNRETAEPRVDDLPGPRAREWVAYHHERAAPSTYVYDFVWDPTAPAEGPFCTDVDGNVLMDFTSHVGAAPLGYNNPKVMEPLREFDLVDPLKIAGQDFYVGAGDPAAGTYPGPATLMERLTDLTADYGLDTVFLSNSGAEAVENALKVCFDHTGGTHAVTFQGGFHGRTLGALSLNRSKAVHRREYPEIAGVADVPYCRDRTCDPSTCDCGFFVAADGEETSQLRRMLDPGRGYLDPREVAAVVVEPVQGEGGYHVPSAAFVDELAAVVEEYGIPLVADEIQSGLGRTGEWWAADHYAIEPDVVTAAKGLRVGATVADEDVFPAETGRLSSTWGGGDILASLQGVLTIDAVADHDLRANATRRGRALVEHLRDADLAPVVDVRGKGLMVGVEFDGADRRDAVIDAALRRGLLTLACGYRTVRLLPPLDVTDREVELGATLFAESVAAVA